MKNIEQEITDLFSVGGVYRIEEIVAKTGISKTVLRQVLNDMLIIGTAIKMPDPNLSYRHVYGNHDVKIGFGISTKLYRFDKTIQRCRNANELVHAS